MRKCTSKQRLALIVPVIAAIAVPFLVTPSASAAENGTTEGSSVTGFFEVTGSGTAITIDTDPPGPPGRERLFNVPLPWRGEFTVPTGVDILQVVVVGGDSPGCRILLDGKVVAQKPRGGSAHCIYDANAAGR